MSLRFTPLFSYSCWMRALTSTGLVGSTHVQGQVGRLRQKSGSDLGTRGQSEVHTEPIPPPSCAQTTEPRPANEKPRREGAEVILERYLAEHGGRDQIIQDTEEAVKTKKRGRKSAGAEPNKRSRRNGHPADTTPPAGAARAGAWQPPAGSWEDHIDSIDACEDEATGKLVVFLNWKNGKKTKHPTEVVYRRCPQKVGHAPLLSDREPRNRRGVSSKLANWMYRCCDSTKTMFG